MNYIINLDWLQVRCSGIIQYPEFMIVKRWQYGTKFFSKIDDVYIMNVHMFTVISDPRSHIIEKETVFIKMINTELYNAKPIENLFAFIKYLNLRFLNFTRIDICADFNTFSNNLHPVNFITKFFANDYIKTKKAPYKVIGNQHLTHTYSYLKIGTSDSQVTAILYDKTKEMKDKKFKNYIFEQWEVSGLNTNSHVWRLEFSIRDHNFKVFDTDIFDYQLLDLKKLDNSEYLKKLYIAIQKMSFNFKRNNGQKNKARMKDVNLFDGMVNILPIKFDCDKKDGTSHIKAVINYLEKASAEIREARSEASQLYDEIAEEIAYSHGLETWFRFKHH